MRTACGSIVVFAAFLFLASVGTPSFAGTAPATIGLVNLTPDDVGDLGKAAGTLGYQTAVAAPEGDLSDKIVFLQVSLKGHNALSAKTVPSWMKYVQQGGSLLIEFDQRTGTDLQRISPMLPSTAWRTSEDPLGPNRLAESDASFFPNAAAVQGFAVPYYYPISPWMAVERGQARYDRFDRTLLRMDDLGVLPAGTEWWTRPLLNREWTIRARGADVAASPLLLTGRYGAGRVAMFASSLASADDPKGEAFWTPVLQWLGQDHPAPAESAPAMPLAVTVSAVPSTQPREGISKSLIALASSSDAKAAPVAEPNTVSPGDLLVSIQNPNPQAVKVKIVARFLSWEHAMVEDKLADATLTASGTTQVRIPLPAPSAISYQEIEARPAFDVRLGILSEDGATLLGETASKIDLTPPVTVAVHTDELRTLPFPFPMAARPDKQMQFRNGLPVYSAAYLPGGTAQATIELSNGVRNIAELATIADVEDPENLSVAALNSGGAIDHKPEEFLPKTWSFFHAEKSSSVTLKVTFPQPVTVTGLTLWDTTADDYRRNARLNPTDAVMTGNGKELARASGLADSFAKQDGQVRIPISPVKLQEFTLALTGTAAGIDLGQLVIQGTTDDPPAAAQGKLSLLLTNALTGEVTRVQAEDVTLAPLEQKQIVVPVPMPAATDAQFYRLDAVFLGSAAKNNATASFPVMTVSGKEPVLQSLDSLEDMDFGNIYPNGASMGFIVTRGFRNVFDNAVGTAEIVGGWGQPDDLVWAFAHGFKQEGKPKTQANRLYVSSSDMRHYSTPWRQFNDGEEFYDVATPLIVDRYKANKAFAKSDIVLLGHSDRWDAGPSIEANHTWQDFEGFNAWMLAHNLPGLHGKTLPELTAEIADASLLSHWYAWQMERYVANIRNLRDSFAREGKKLILTSQGAPVMPLSQAPEIDSVLRGNSDDSTWGMAQEDLIFTTGRQMGVVALNPTMAMSTLNQWQWVSGLLSNPIWHAPVATTEPSRRREYDRAFRGALRPDGGYGAMSIYGYNTNGGYPYTINELDYNLWEQTMIKQSLLYPTAPIGAGVIVSNAKYEKPENVRFDCESGREFPEARLVQDAVQRLGYAGVSVSFSGNASLLEGWKNDAPLVLLNLQDFSEAEQKTVAQMAAAGRHLAIFQATGTTPLSAETAALFGVTADGAVADGKEVARVQDRPVVQKGNCLYIPAAPGNLSQQEADVLSSVLRPALDQAITFPSGTTGYGFVSNGRNFAVVEDWREEGRVVDLRIRADARATGLLAVDTNDNRPLPTDKDGADWVIRLPLRPGDGSLVAYKEILP